MKRLWLTVFLTALILCAAVIGIYREANHTLTHILTRLQETLPAHSQFTYRSAHPSLFIGGATLEDVTLRTPTTSFHADTIRLGHPHFLHDGSISLASLLLEHSDYQGPHFNLRLTKAVFRHLLIPASSGTTRTDLTTLGTRSLAAIMSFDPQHLSSLRFSRGHVEGLDFTFPPHEKFLFSALSLTHMTVERFTVEGYGTGSRVFGDANHLSLALALSHDNTDTWPSPFTNLLLPPHDESRSELPITVTLDTITARNGHTQWLQHASHDASSLAQKFYNNPLQNIWESPGALRLHELNMHIGDVNNGSSARLENLTMIRRNDGALLQTETDLQGIHLSPAGKQHFSFPVNGHHTVLHVSESSQSAYGLWNTLFSSRMTLPSIGVLTLNARAHLPTETPFLWHEGAPFAQQAIINDATVAVKGDRFFDLWTHFAALNATSIERQKQRDTILKTFGLLITTRPLLTPMMDYILAPKDRTLTINFGTLSLDDLVNLPFTGPLNTLLDQAHVTAVTVH